MIRPEQAGESYGYRPDRQGVDSVSASARVVVPIIVDLFHPSSVLDLGCGAGDWLEVFSQSGVQQIDGYDGPWVPREALKISPARFHEVDFYTAIPELPRVELAVCLEVGEHVAENLGRQLVSVLCRSADLVLWSAAIPGQGGHEHINEHFHDYWIERFKAEGFAAFDLIRPRIWGNPQVSWWYQQNILIFANESARRRHSLVEAPFIRSLVHPFHYERVRDPKNYGLRQIIKCLPHYLLRRFRR